MGTCWALRAISKQTVEARNTDAGRKLRVSRADSHRVARAPSAVTFVSSRRVGIVCVQRTRHTRRCARIDLLVVSCVAVAVVHSIRSVLHQGRGVLWAMQARCDSNLADSIIVGVHTALITREVGQIVRAHVDYPVFHSIVAFVARTLQT